MFFVEFVQNNEAVAYTMVVVLAIMLKFYHVVFVPTEEELDDEKWAQ